MTDFVLQGSKTSDPVSWPTHRAWFEIALVDPDRRVLIGEADGEPVGVLRFDVVEDEATASVYSDRRKGEDAGSGRSS